MPAEADPVLGALPAEHRHAAVARRHVRPARRRRPPGLVAGLSQPGLPRRARRPTPCSSTSRSPRRWGRSGPTCRPTPSTPTAFSGRVAATGCSPSFASARRVMQQHARAAVRALVRYRGNGRGLELVSPVAWCPGVSNRLADLQRPWARSRSRAIPKLRGNGSRLSKGLQPDLRAGIRSRSLRAPRTRTGLVKPVLSSRAARR